MRRVEDLVTHNFVKQNFLDPSLPVSLRSIWLRFSNPHTNQSSLVCSLLAKYITSSLLTLVFPRSHSSIVASNLLFCGSGRIRTSDRVSPIPLFESGAFNHSATLPYILLRTNGSRYADSGLVLATSLRSDENQSSLIFIHSATLPIISLKILSSLLLNKRISFY
jgi:hypothetical protein